MNSSLIDTLFCVICGCPLIIDDKIRLLSTNSGSLTSSPVRSPRENSVLVSPRQSQLHGPIALSTPLPLPSKIDKTDKSNSNTVSGIERSLSPPEILFSSPKQNEAVKLSQTKRKSSSKISFYMKGRNKQLKPSSMVVATPSLEFYHWFTSMVDQFEDFGIPCIQCIDKIMNKFHSDENEHNRCVEIYQLSSCSLFQTMSTIDEQLEETEREVVGLMNQIEELENKNKELIQKKELIKGASEIINQHIVNSFINESQIISVGYKAYSKLVDKKRLMFDLILPIQKVLTWNQLFQRSQIVPELSALSLINIVKSIPISPILSILFLQLKILANLIKYEYVTVLIDPADKQKKSNIPSFCSKDITSNSKKSNRFSLQCLLMMLNELSMVLVKESSQSFFLIYGIENDTINGIDFIGYDSKKWCQALDCFLTNTEHCYKWILRHYK